jgi:hypothetical protein
VRVTGLPHGDLDDCVTFCLACFGHPPHPLTPPPPPPPPVQQTVFSGTALPALSLQSGREVTSTAGEDGSQVAAASEWQNCHPSETGRLVTLSIRTVPAAGVEEGSVECLEFFRPMSADEKSLAALQKADAESAAAAALAAEAEGGDSEGKEADAGKAPGKAANKKERSGSVTSLTTPLTPGEECLEDHVKVSHVSFTIAEGGVADLPAIVLTQATAPAMYELTVVDSTQFPTRSLGPTAEVSTYRAQDMKGTHIFLLFFSRFCVPTTSSTR